MKVRVKLASSRKTVELEDGATLGQLKKKLVDEFQLNEIHFDISLNNKDVLEEEEKCLNEFGIVSGDLIFILTNNGYPMDEEPSTSQKSKVFISSSSSSEFVPEVSTHIKDEEIPQDEAMDEDDICDKTIIDKCLKEPLLCRESSTTSIPSSLNLLYSNSDCVSEADALWVVIHTLMLESGFNNIIRTGNTSQSKDKHTLPPDWRGKHYYYGKYYHIDLGSELICKVIGISIGSQLIVHGELGEEIETKQITIPVSKYIKEVHTAGEQTYKNLHRLSQIVKDAITLPLLQEMYTALGLPQILGFLGLHFELKLKILSYLDVGSLVRFGEVNKQMNMIHKDPYLWRKLHFSIFGGRSNTELSQDWYQIFKEKYRVRKQFYKRMQQSTFMIPDLSSRHHVPPFHPLYPQHGIIGGDYDLFPRLPGIPGSYTGRVGLPGSGLHILRPRYDPEPSDPLLSLRSRNNSSSQHWFGRAMGNRFM